MSPGRADTLSVVYEHMFAFPAEKDAAPRSRELPVGLADRVRPTTPVAGRLLPVPAPLAPLFPDGALRRGTTTTVAGRPGHGATTLALALLAAASQAGYKTELIAAASPTVCSGNRLTPIPRRDVPVVNQSDDGLPAKLRADC